MSPDDLADVYGEVLVGVLEEGRGKVRQFLKEKGHGDLEGGDG